LSSVFKRRDNPEVAAQEGIGDVAERREVDIASSRSNQARKAIV
jgi:hypothetical protein